MRSLYEARERIEVQFLRDFFDKRVLDAMILS
jgi:hypothetical protein